MEPLPKKLCEEYLKDLKKAVNKNWEIVIEQENE